MWSFQQSWEGGLSLTTAVKVDAVAVASCQRRCADKVFLFRFYIVQIQGRGHFRTNSWTMSTKSKCGKRESLWWRCWCWSRIHFFDLLVPDDWLGHRRSSFVYRMSIFYCFHSIYFTIFLVLQSRIMSSVKCINTLKQVPEASKGHVNGGYHSENPKIEDWL